jgi:hypothetical protein
MNHSNGKPIRAASNRLFSNIYPFPCEHYSPFRDQEAIRYSIARADKASRQLAPSKEPIDRVKTWCYIIRARPRSAPRGREPRV